MTRACILRCVHACTWSIYIDNTKMRPRGDKARATLNARNEKFLQFEDRPTRDAVFA